MPDLSSARLKLARAAHHFDDLDSAQDEFIEAFDARAAKTGERLFHVETKPEMDRSGERWQVTRLSGMTELPGEWGLMAGDGIHNVRCALDHLVCALVRSRDKEPTKKNGFPIKPTRPDKRELQRMRAETLENVPDDARKRIEKLQPYEKGHAVRARRLRALAVLDNLDKHQLVTPTVAVVVGHEEPGLLHKVAHAGPGQPVVRYKKNAHLRVGSEVWRTGPNTTVLAAPLITEIAFGTANVDINELRAIHGEVVQIIDDFAPAVEG